MLSWQLSYAGEVPHLAAIELGDGQLSLGLVCKGDKRTAARVAVVVAQHVQLNDVPKGRKDLLQVPFGGLIIAAASITAIGCPAKR